MADKNKKNDITWVWKYYEDGRNYNNSLVPNKYDEVNTNVEFFTGNQWIHLPETPAMMNLPKPVFNIIKRVTSMFVASLTANATTIAFEPLAYYDGQNVEDPDSNAADFATAEVRNLFDKFRMNAKVREALFDGAQTGDYAAHFYWDPDALPYGGAYGPYRGEIQMEMVDGINVMFGNPNTRDVQKQPYILVIGRDTVDHLRWEAERYRKKTRKGASMDDTNLIQTDRETQWQLGIGGQTEIIDNDGTGKCLYAYCYTKEQHEEKVINPETGLPEQEPVLDKDGDPIPLLDKDGNPMLDFDGEPIFKTKDMTHIVTSVHVTKATRNCIIYEDIDTGLTLYPIAWGNWEHQKNQYHGRGLVTGIIPNQIYINTMFALTMRHLQLLGFPKTIYNADMVPAWSNSVGQAIGVRGLQPGQSLEQVVAYNLQPADMSNQIMQTIDKALTYTKECLGATDVQMGNVKPENTSAMMVMQSAAEVPLENIRSNMYEWIHDVGNICLDMMGTYYGERPIVRERTMMELATDPTTGQPMIDPMTGQMRQQQVTRKVIEEFDFSQLNDLWLNCSVSVGATTYYSEIAMVQTLDNLRKDGVLGMVEYLERLPDKLLPRKAELITQMKEQAMMEQQMQGMPNGMAAGAGMPGVAVANGGGAAGVAPNAPSASQVPVPKGPSGASQPKATHGLDRVVNNSALPDNVESKFNLLPNKAKNALSKAQALKNG